MSLSSSLLLGPPEARNPPPPPPASAAAAADPFLNRMDSGYNSSDSDFEYYPGRIAMGLTENNSATHLSSGSPCLDFFFQVVPSTRPATVTALLSSAWAHNPLTALKLVCHLRGVRGTGKSDKKGFYACALWLHSHHPKTLALNVASLADFGYMKDLLEILYCLMHGPDARGANKPARKPFRRTNRWGGKKTTKKRCKRASREERIEAEMARVRAEVSAAAEARHAERANKAKRAVERYRRDPEYRFLHDRISEFFAERLASDLENLKQGMHNRISLAAKWCPSLDLSFDRSTLICESIARRMFPKDSDPEYENVEEEHYAYRVRDRLRKQVLVPLRKALELPEVYIAAGEWGSLPYSRVASVAMKNYTELFTKHDGERFREYLDDVKKGKAKIAAGALLPHQIAESVHYADHHYPGDEAAIEVAELQWRRMVGDMLGIGKLSNCIAVCDVSGSMEGTPMDVCVAMGLLLSELSEEPWKGRVITFSAKPQLHRIKGETLRDKLNFVSKMEWGQNTDFQKVFDQLLKVAVKGKLAPEEMIKRVFVFSDMEFDEASANDWETDYEVICRKFEAAGYGSCVPEIVFWNLRDSRSIPVTSKQKGVALVSGFSKNLMKLFLKEEEAAFNPEAIMEEAISGKEYNNLVVFD